MKNLFPEYTSEKDKRDNLQAMAHHVEETSYFKQLNAEELEVRREKLTENVIRLSRIEREKKEIMNRMKLEAKPLADENQDLLTALETKVEEVEGVLYHVDDQDAGMMNSYNENGEFIKSRRLRPDEKIASMFNLKISEQS